MLGRISASWSRHRLDLALAGLFLAVVAPFVPELTAQGGARYALTAAIVEQQTVRLDDYRPLLSFDKVERGPHVYSDKAPGQPILGVPVLAAGEALGTPPGTEHRVEENVGVWSQIFVFCALPGALCLVLMRRHAARTESAHAALLGSVALAFGTMLLPLSATLYGHVFVAMLTFAAWHLVSRAEVGTTTVLVAGTLAAVATASEYPAIMAGAIIGLWVLARHGFRRALVYGAPHLVALPLLIAYNNLAYGHAATGYTAKTSGGRLNWLRIPDPGNVVEILFGVKGFVFTPVVLVALVWLVIGLRRRDHRLVVPAAIVAAYFVLQAGWPNPWGGAGPGPRYIAPALPFLVVPAARGLTRLSRPLRRTIMAVGFLSMGLVVITYELVPPGGALIATQLDYLFGEKGLNPTLFTLALGPLGWLVHGMLIALAARAVRSAWLEVGTDRTPSLLVDTR